MPHLYIDGQRIEAKNGQTIIEAAYANGLEIPHFCWHPELSVAGNCRMCLVEVGMPKRSPDGSFEVDGDGNPVISYIPKLQIACATPVSEGMRVNTKNEKVITAQEAVMEFLLINHPLDCPICDEAGECKLQEYAFKHSKKESRFDEEKNHKDKRQQWGPNVMFDAERCISCSRCIRYAQEVAHQDVLTFVQRGDHVTIKLFNDTQFDNPNSMNVIELCPVGALTSPDFRFKARVWEMSFNDSISPADSTGSNIRLGVRNNEILRVEPRTNMYVNKYWLSDDARLNHYEFVNKSRVTEPMIRSNGELKSVTWAEAHDEAARKLQQFKPDEIFFLASPKATTEDNYLFARFAKNIIKSTNTDILMHIDEAKIKTNGVADGAPNTMGAKEIGLESGKSHIKLHDLPDAIAVGKIRAVWVLEEDLSTHPHLIDAFKDLELLIVNSYNHNTLTEIANVVFATSTYAEIQGTYVNKDRRVQLLQPALVTKENYRFMGMKMSRLDKFGAQNDRWNQHELRNCRQSWRSIQGVANIFRAGWDYNETADIFEEIATKISSFAHMNYNNLLEYQGLVLGRGERPDPKLVNYVSHKMKPQYSY